MKIFKQGPCLLDIFFIDLKRYRAGNHAEASGHSPPAEEVLDTFPSCHEWYPRRVQKRPGQGNECSVSRLEDCDKVNVMVARLGRCKGVHQRYGAIRAIRESGTVFRTAFWTEHATSSRVRSNGLPLSRAFQRPTSASGLGDGELNAGCQYERVRILDMKHSSWRIRPCLA